MGLTLLLVIIMQAIGAPLVNKSAPLGIVSFEFAGKLPIARQMLDAWGEQGRLYAALSLGLDYLFLAAYATSIALACTLVSQRLLSGLPLLAKIGILLAWGQFGAALLDCIENVALIRVLLGSQSAIWPRLAWWCAAPKFAIVGAGLVYVLVGSVLVVSIRRQSQHP
jgi:hypothetical protein